MRNQAKEPTFTSIIEGWLAKQDDFRTVKEIMEGTGVNQNRVCATLSHGKKYKAIDFMVDNGVTYWFSTPDTDMRTKHVEEKVREEPGSRRARKANSRTGGAVRKS